MLEFSEEGINYSFNRGKRRRECQGKCYGKGVEKPVLNNAKHKRRLSVATKAISADR